MSIKSFLPSHLGLDQLFSIFENIDNPVYVCDPETYEVLYANKSIREERGLVEGRKCFAVFQGLDQPCEFCPNDKIFGENLGKTYVWEFQNRVNKRWYRCYDKAIPWPDGRMVRYEMAIDITDHKAGEEALMRSEAYYRTLADSAQDFIFIINKDYKVEFANKLSAQFFKTSADELKGKSIEELFPATVTERLKANIQRIFASGETHRFEESVPILDAQLWLETKLVALRDDLGSVYAVLGISRDVTDRKKAENALKESEEKFRSLAEQSPNMIFINQNGKIIYANRRCEEVMEYSREELCSPGFDFIRLHAPESRDAVRTNFQRHLQGEEVPPAEYVLLSKTGRRINSLTTARLIYFGGERAILSTVIDITEQKKAILEQQRLQEHLVEAQKMEAIGTLASGIAHDFNNMITSVRGFAQLSLADLDPAHHLYADLKQIETITTRAGNLTRQLLLFSRKHPIELRAFDINNTCLNLEKMLRRLIGENITITTATAPDAWKVFADENKIEQVIVNLAINARDAMPNGGLLTIRTSNCELNESQASGMPNARPGKFVAVSVADTGTGINREDLRRIFEPFYSTKDPSKSSGLGLAVVYGIIKQHQGWITVETQPGKGATFSFFLPALTKDIPAAPLAEQPAEREFQRQESPPQRKAGRILLVEDEESVREFSRRLLETMGYWVVSTANATQALAEFERHAGAFDLLLSDVVLPDRDGVSLAEDLSGRKPKLRVLLASGYMQDTSLWPTLQKRGYCFLHKPYGRTDLLMAIKELLM